MLLKKRIKKNNVNVGKERMQGKPWGNKNIHASKPVAIIEKA
jgi:hypothetical protein